MSSEFGRERRPGPPPVHADRDAAICAAVSGGATIAGTARAWGISESRVRIILKRERAAAEPEPVATGSGSCCQTARAEVWAAIGKTANHRRRDCGCITCEQYRAAADIRR